MIVKTRCGTGAGMRDLFRDVPMNLTWDEERSCKGKVKYGHRATAERAVKDMAKKGKHGLEAYKCRRYCGKWHIGHYSPPSVVVEIEVK